MYIKAIALELLKKYPVASKLLSDISWEVSSDPDLAAEGYLQPSKPIPVWEYGSVDYDLVKLLKKEEKSFINYYFNSSEAYDEGILDCGNLDGLFAEITNVDFTRPTKSSALGSANDWVRGRD